MAGPSTQSPPTQHPSTQGTSSEVPRSQARPLAPPGTVDPALLQKSSDDEDEVIGVSLLDQSSDEDSEDSSLDPTTDNRSTAEQDDQDEDMFDYSEFLA